MGSQAGCYLSLSTATLVAIDWLRKVLFLYIGVIKVRSKNETPHFSYFIQENIFSSPMSITYTWFQINELHAKNNGLL
jgi:hypothetical protein